MGPVEIIILAILAAVSLYVLGGLLWGEPKVENKPPSVADSSPTPSTTRPLPGTAAATVGKETAPAAPTGTYLKWPVATALLLAILGLISAAFGSGGNPAAFLLAWALNPLNWAMGYAAFQIGKIRCPHCRRSVPMTQAKNAPVGATLKCPQCANNFIKPAG
jgi:hypothetical protein